MVLNIDWERERESERETEKGKTPSACSLPKLAGQVALGARKSSQVSHKGYRSPTSWIIICCLIGMLEEAELEADPEVRMRYFNLGGSFPN